MIIMITGSRDFIDAECIYDALRLYKWKSPLVVHGAQRGADRHADKQAKRLGMRTLPFPPDQKKPSPERYHERNDKMLALKPDIVLAFRRIGAENRGTDSVIYKAEGLGITVQKFER